MQEFLKAPGFRPQRTHRRRPKGTSPRHNGLPPPTRRAGSLSSHAWFGFSRPAALLPELVANRQVRRVLTDPNATAPRVKSNWIRVEAGADQAPPSQDHLWQQAGASKRSAFKPTVLSFEVAPAQAKTLEEQGFVFDPLVGYVNPSV